MQPEKQRFSLKLGTSTVAVNNTNITSGATAALTNSNGASYTLDTAAPSGNVVKAEFTIESGATVALTATGIKSYRFDRYVNIKSYLTTLQALSIHLPYRFNPPNNEVV